MQAVLNLVWGHLLPAMNTTAPLPDNTDAQAKLAKKLNSLSFSPPSGALSSSIAARVSGKRYTLEPNPLKARTISFDFTGNGCTVTLRNPNGKHQITCGAGVWHDGTTTLFSDSRRNDSPRAVASGIWSDENTYVITVRLYETAFVHTLICHFAGDRLTIDGSVNVNFGPTTYSLTGRSAL
jgi:hypothetical protein